MTFKSGSTTTIKNIKTMWLKIICMKFAVFDSKKLTLSTFFTITSRTQTQKTKIKMDRICFWQSAKTTIPTLQSRNPWLKLWSFRYYPDKISSPIRVWLMRWTIAWINSVNSKCKKNPNKVFPPATYSTNSLMGKRNP